MKHTLPQGRTVWHITVGTYGSRLHGSGEATVDRKHNQRGDPFIRDDEQRCQDERARMRGEPVYLSHEHRVAIEQAIPQVCRKSSWHLYACAAPAPPDNDHFHALLDADPSETPKGIRELFKRRLTQSLEKHFPRPANGLWWVKGGSTKPVKDAKYFGNVIGYIQRQRTTK